MSDFEPKQFGKYLLLQRLAVGGMAEIYRAKTYGVDGFEKELVIKRILPHCSADKDFITMLVDEAKLSVLLSHANIVQVYDLSKVGDDYYIAMELIHGVNLRDVIYRCREKEVPLPPEIAVYICSEICKGLDYAHRKTDQENKPLDIVHRDISPQNILISFEGEVKIVDFGIAKAAMNISHTMAGILKGKIAYMSPEQAMGKTVDKRTDIFSSGILLYEMLTQTKLFTGESQFEVLKKIRTTRITKDKLPNIIPEQLKIIVEKALAYNPDTRYQTAGDFQIVLTKYLYTNHIDFSPRKLSAFIRELFADQLKDEQVELARETAAEGLTSTMSVQEGAKQVSIVHRQGDERGREITDRTEGVREAAFDTMVTPIQQMPTGEKEAHGEGKMAGAQTKQKEKKKSALSLFKGLAALLILSAAGYAAYRLAPMVTFWESKEAPPPELAQTITGTINVSSDPRDARIFLDDINTNKVTPTILDNLEVGRSYRIRVEKEDFTPTQQDVKVVDASPIQLMLTLTPKLGTLNIITDPPEASVMINGRLVGKTTPTTIDGLPLTTDLRIILSKPDYEDYEQTINLTSAKPQKISTKLNPIQPKTGRISISSVPSGAQVFLDGKDSGRTTPATLANLEPKKYQVSLRMDGYETWSGSYDVGTSSRVPVDVTLAKVGEAKAVKTIEEAEGEKPPTTPLKEEAAAAKDEVKEAAEEKGLEIGEEILKPAEEKLKGTETPPEVAEVKPEAPKTVSLEVTSTPSGASITLDGKSTGQKTPATLIELKQGATYRVGLTLKGYASKSIKKTVSKVTDTLTFQLKKEVSKPKEAPPATAAKPVEEPKEPAAKGTFGKIRVTSSPSGADVFMNAEFKGKTPLTASVQAGSVRVLVNMEGRSRYSKTVTVKPGQTVRLTDITLGGLYAEVSLSSTPPAAKVIFDGKKIPAKTPVTIRKVRTDRSHTVTIERSGYRPWTRTFTLDGGNKSFHAVLQPK